MATIQNQLVCDSSLLANFKAWASAIGAALSTFTWVQANDTGQVVWTASVLAISQAVGNGTTGVYSYSLTSGPVLRVGMSVTVSGFANAGFNGAKVITALGAGTFTAAATPNLTETVGASGTTTAISAVPGASAWVYEIWQPADGLTNFFLKLEYGNTGTTTQPSLQLTISATTDGAGNATGIKIGPTLTAGSGFTAQSTSVGYECDFSGAAGRFGAMLWRNGGSNCQQLFAIERSINASGAYTSSYVTLFTFGNNSGSGQPLPASQRSLVFGLGPATYLTANVSICQGGWAVRIPATSNNTGSTATFNNSIPLDTPAPLIGYFDYPATVVGVGDAGDLAEGVTLQVSLYGSTRTYMAGKSGIFAFSPLNNSYANTAICLRYD